MKAQVARFVISLISMIVALIAFMGMGAGWMPVVAAMVIVISGFIISEVVFRRLADHETYRRDLEDRVRNPPL
jgi:fatty acid desaturase